MTTAARIDPQAFLARFGLTSFRDGQREVIDTVLAGRDCLCVMPTGGGKSLCYQLPAIAQGGVTLVVSPLIALMKDQVDQLTARGLPATFINSTLSLDEQARRLDQMAAGEHKLVYVVPERFRSRMFLDAMRRCQLDLLAIDEAHCVSEWGHDFRPDYARLGHFRSLLGNPPTIALTATATDAVRRDVVELLNLSEPRVFITGFARPNLFYSAEMCSTDRDKDQALFQFLEATPGAGIVYASTRKRSEEIGQRIAERTGRRTTVYHAGLAADDRRAAQDAFMQGESEIAVATMAFGMGIDKSNVRFVVHYNLPGSLEAYYQEAGRAGRDGLPAKCLLLAGGGDRQIHEFFIESAYPAKNVVREVYNFLCRLDQETVEMTRQEIKETLALSISEDGIGACEKLLERAGVLERLETTENAAAIRLTTDVPTLVELLPQQAKVKRQVLRVVEQIVGPRRHEWCYIQPREMLRRLEDMDSAALSRHLRELSDLSSVEYVPPFRGRAVRMLRRDVPFAELDIDFESLEKQKAAEYERIDTVLRFAREHRCRQQQIVQYFGQTEAEPCGHCDNCQAQTSGVRDGDSREATGPVLEAVRIVLSGVARIARTKVGVGKQLLAKMLCGSTDKAVTRNRLDKLTTFGKLGHLKQPEVVQFIEALLLIGLLETNEIEPFRPILEMTALGNEVMSGRGPTPRLAVSDELWKRLGGKVAPHRSPGQGSEAAIADAADDQLAFRLRNWRNEVSRAQSVPAFHILTNAVVDALARERPRSLAALETIKGIGPAKVRDFGAAIIEIVQGTQAAPLEANQPCAASNDFVLGLAESSKAPAHDVAPQPKTEQASQTAVDSQATSTSEPSYYWTWRLLEAGFTPDECATIRSLTVDVLRDHALRAADRGLTIRAEWFLSHELIAQIEQALAGGAPTRIRDILEKLPRGTRYEDVQLVQRARGGPEASGNASSA